MATADTKFERLVKGDPEEWSEFVERHGGLVTVLAHRLGLGPEEQQDAFQNTFLKAYRWIGGVREPDRVSSWLYTIAKNEARAILKTRGRLESSEAAPLDNVLARIPDVQPTAEEILLRLDLARQVRAVVGSLDSRCRELITALYLTTDRTDYTRISEELEMPIGSIGPTRGRCLEKIRKRLLDRTDVSNETSPRSAESEVTEEQPPIGKDKVGR